MVIRTLIDKSTTIKKNSLDNFGLHPISSLSYGVDVTRVLIHFNTSHLEECINDKTIVDKSQARHILKMKNCGSLSPKNRTLASSDVNGIKSRASSFNVIAFRINKKWDQGIGFDNENDVWKTGYGAVSKDGSTWYNATTEETWDEEGIYSVDTIYKEYDKFLSGDKQSIVVAKQEFDLGNENLELDITDYVNAVLDKTYENYGICLMFTPELEETSRSLTQYVGFFNEKTNTIFEPILETTYETKIQDDRYNFFTDKKNKLCFCSIINDEFENLDELPKCSIDGVEYEVKQETKGVYSVEVQIDSEKYAKDSILYDVWTSLKYKGEILDDEELEFVVKGKRKLYSFREYVKIPKPLNPIIIGINDNEQLNRGEVRLIKTFYKIPYTHLDYITNCPSFYRLYVKDGDREVTIIDWDNITHISDCGLFKIETNTLVPSHYHIDIKLMYGNEIRIFKNQIEFNVVSDTTNEKY